MELTLQLKLAFFKRLVYFRRNPYFIGINSAIKNGANKGHSKLCRNPYFIGINSAIDEELKVFEVKEESQSLFYWN